MSQLVILVIFFQITNLIIWGGLLVSVLKLEKRIARIEEIALHLVRKD